MASAEEHQNMAVHHLNQTIRATGPEEFENQACLTATYAIVALSQAVLDIRDHLME